MVPCANLSPARTAKGRGSCFGQTTKGRRRALGVPVRNNLRTVGKCVPGARTARYSLAEAASGSSLAEDRPAAGFSAPGATLPGDRAGAEFSQLTQRH